jgi:ribosomal protein L16/L10AE
MKLERAANGMGIPEYEAKKYEARVSGGNILLSVHCETGEQRERAKLALQQTGAEDISATTESPKV